MTTPLLQGYNITVQSFTRLQPVLWEALCDLTPLDGTFRPAGLLRADGYDKSLVSAFLRDCTTLPWPSDRLRRVTTGIYRWQFAVDDVPGGYREGGREDADVPVIVDAEAAARAHADGTVERLATLRPSCTH